MYGHQKVPNVYFCLSKGRDSAVTSSEACTMHTPHLRVISGSCTVSSMALGGWVRVSQTSPAAELPGGLVQTQTSSMSDSVAFAFLTSSWVMLMPLLARGPHFLCATLKDEKQKQRSKTLDRAASSSLHTLSTQQVEPNFSSKSN